MTNKTLKEKIEKILMNSRPFSENSSQILSLIYSHLEKKMPKKYSKIWYRWHGCREKNCPGCEYEMEDEWEEIKQILKQELVGK